MLASDMRSVLCSTIGGMYTGSKRVYHNDSAACDALLSLGSWTVDKFLKSYSDGTFGDLLSTGLRNRIKDVLPPSLLELHQHMHGVVTGTFPDADKILQRADEDYLLWNGADAPAWVACNQRNKTCYGKVSKDDWYSSRKAQKCTDVFSEQVKLGNVNASAVGLDICNLNSKTDAMCKVWINHCL